MKLEKAKLIVHSDPSGGAKDVEFMFNPSELDFTRQVKWHSDPGNRGTTLLPKVNFAGVEPYSFTLQNLLFDTYEKKTSVLKDYIDNIKKGATARASANARPPVYILTWHDTYFHCVVTNLNYRITLFLSDGTPVKAIVNISLQEVDPESLSGSKPATPTGRKDSRLNNGNNRGKSTSSNRNNNPRRSSNTGSKPSPIRNNNPRRGKPPSRPQKPKP
jgi:Contractile injection system tube protein